MDSAGSWCGGWREPPPRFPWAAVVLLLLLLLVSGD